jgi:hypothetical protein
VVSGHVVDLDAVRELRRLVDGLDGCPDVGQVRAVGLAAWRAGDRQWMAWAGEVFDVAHDRCCECRRGSA